MNCICHCAASSGTGVAQYLLYSSVNSEQMKQSNLVYPYVHKHYIKTLPSCSHKTRDLFPPHLSAPAPAVTSRRKSEDNSCWQVLWRESNSMLKRVGASCFAIEVFALALACTWAQKSISLSPNCCQCACNWRTSNRFELPWLSLEIERIGGKILKSCNEWHAFWNLPFTMTISCSQMSLSQ